MVEIWGSGTGEDEGISEIGISHSVLPTSCGPKGLGRDGIGLRYEIMVGCGLLEGRGKWSRDGLMQIGYIGFEGSKY